MAKKAQVPMKLYWADRSVIQYAKSSFKSFCRKPARKASGPMGIGYVDLGTATLQVDLGFILGLAAGPMKYKRAYLTRKEVTIDRAAVDRAASLLQRYPKYIENDLEGIRLEIDLEERFKAIDHKDAQAFYRALEGTNLSKFSDPEILQDKLSLLSKIASYGDRWLEVDHTRKTFEGFIRSGGKFEKQWAKFLRASVLPKKKPGRPRNNDYDRFFQLRAGNPTKFTYGKLAQMVANFDAAQTSLIRNRLRAAAAQRRKHPQKNLRFL
jgi:hypothetical protein